MKRNTSSRKILTINVFDKNTEGLRLLEQCLYPRSVEHKTLNAKLNPNTCKACFLTWLSGTSSLKQRTRHEFLASSCLLTSKWTKHIYLLWCEAPTASACLFVKKNKYNGGYKLKVKIDWLQRWNWNKPLQSSSSWGQSVSTKRSSLIEKQCKGG